MNLRVDPLNFIPSQVVKAGDTNSRYYTTFNSGYEATWFLVFGCFQWLYTLFHWWHLER